jgi:RNA polymerase sigma-70 factor (ECF subfamily)
LDNISDDIILALIEVEETFEEGLKKLIIKYQEPLYWHIRRMVHVHEDADDVIQNTFIKVYRGIRKFKKESKLYTWLYRIASNEAITFLNKKKKAHGRMSRDGIENLENKLRADEYFDGDEAQVALIKAIETLPQRQKQVFRLRYYDEMSYKDMSEILDITIGSLKASYHHAVQKIESYLTDNIDYVR